MRFRQSHQSTAPIPVSRIPSRFALVSGSSEGGTLLNSFDNALLNAGVGDTNLVRMSSILPPGASMYRIEELDLPKGGLIPVAYAALDSKRSGELISAAVAVGIPDRPSDPGVIMEFEDYAPLDRTEKVVRQMVREAFRKRNRPLARILTKGAEHQIEQCASVFSGVVLWFDEPENVKKDGGNGV